MDQELTPARRRQVMACVLLGVVLAGIDGAIANIALPTIARELHATEAGAVWVVNIYQLATTVCLLPVAALGESQGLKRMYGIGLALFTAASLLCALSPTLPVLVAARLVQGVGGACMAALGGAMVRAIYPRQLLGQAFATIALAVAMSAALGPSIAAAILSVATWPWLFLVNVPLGLVAVPLFLRVAPAGATRPRPLDLAGALLSAAALDLLVTGVDGLGGSGRSWAYAELAAGAACGALFALLAGGMFALINGGAVSGAGLAAALADKQAVAPSDYSQVNRIARGVFSTVNDFIAAPQLGAVVRAWLDGQIPRLRPYASSVLPALVPWAATAVLLAAIYGYALISTLRGRRCLVPLAFLIGAFAWAVGYNLNDPEHWVNLTAPTLVLFATTFPPVAVVLGLPIWATATVAINLALLAIPTATYPLRRYEAELRQQFTQRDLLVYFANYPGRAYLGFFNLSGLRGLKLDLVFEQAPNLTAFFGMLDQTITDTLRDGGRVVVFDVLDGDDWEAPWPNLTAQGLTKDDLYSHLASRFTISRKPGIAGLKVWQISLPPGS